MRLHYLLLLIVKILLLFFYYMLWIFLLEVVIYCIWKMYILLQSSMLALCIWVSKGLCAWCIYQHLDSPTHIDPKCADLRAEDAKFVAFYGIVGNLKSAYRTTVGFLHTVHLCENKYGSYILVWATFVKFISFIKIISPSSSMIK